MSFQGQDYLSRQAGSSTSRINWYPHCMCDIRSNPCAFCTDPEKKLTYVNDSPSSANFHGLLPKTRASSTSNYAKISTIWEREANKENIPPNLHKEEAFHVPKEGTQPDLNQKAGHNDPRQHIPCTSGQRRFPDSNIRRTGTGLMERDSSFPGRHHTSSDNSCCQCSTFILHPFYQGGQGGNHN